MKSLLSKRTTSGLTRVELIVVVFVIFIFAAIFCSVPDRNMRRKAERIGCVNNLKAFGCAIRMWGNDNGDKYSMGLSLTNGGTMEFLASPNVFPHFQILSNELQTPKVLICGADERNPATNFTTDFNDSHLSYFIGADADETNPSMFLAGDRNISVNSREQSGLVTLTTNQVVGWTRKIHKNQGNILFVDGHVDQLSTTRLRDLVKNTGVTTNRLAIP